MKVKKIIRTLAVAPDLWAKAKEKAEKDGVSLSSVISEYLERYVGEKIIHTEYGSIVRSE